MAQITLKDAIAILIADQPFKQVKMEHIYHADERTVWELERLVVDESSTCGFSIKCKAISYAANGKSYVADEILHYGDVDNLLFSSDDKFFDNEEEAYSERAQILSDLILGADWKNES